MGNRRDSSTLSRFHLGDLHVHPDRMVVVRDGVDIALEPLWMEILVVLAQKACSADETDRTVSTSELMLEVWKTDRYTDNPVTKAISGLRKAIGDDTHNPRYIKTIHRRGYRVIAPVLLPDGYLRLSNPADIWRHGNPYVGLAAFDAEHADVFVGRNNVTAKLLDAMSAQIDNELRFVLLVGASGCGKTSLLRAGALPRLTSEKRASPLHSISVADCDLSAITDGDLLMPLASALCAWSLPGGQVFSMQTPGSLKERLSEAPEAIPTLLTQAFQRHPMRDLEANPHAHLLLIVDHAEALVSTPRSPDALAAFEHALCALCETPRVLVMMVARSDYYPQLVQALPALTARKAGGHIDLLAPNRGEISEIIRRPAELASLQFETGESRLDDALRDAAVGQPDALPLLQHTLHALYEQRTEQGTLTWDAYRSIGGLEGAIAHHAEQVFSALPAQAQAALDTVLGRLVVHGTDNDAVTARRVRRDSLSDDANTLVDAFIAGRLFVATLQEGHPHAGVAHEAILRQWPRAREWGRENRRLLLAKARLQQATKHWIEEEKDSDHLLNPGRQLEEGEEVLPLLHAKSEAKEIEFITASKRLRARKNNFRRGISILLIFLTSISFGFALIAIQSNKETKRALSSLVKQADAFRATSEILFKNANTKDAEPAFLATRETLKQAHERNPKSQEILFQYATSSYWLGNHHLRNNDLEKVRHYWNSYLDACKKLIELSPENPAWNKEISYAYNNIGNLDLAEANTYSALLNFKKSLQIKEKIAATKNEDYNLQAEIADTLSWIGSAEESIAKYKSALKRYEKQIEILSAELPPESITDDQRRQLGNSLWRLARLTSLTGNGHRAANIIEKSIKTLSEVANSNANQDIYKRDLSNAHLEASFIYKQIKKHDLATLHINKAFDHINSIRMTEESPRSWLRLKYTINFHYAIESEANKNKWLAADSISKLEELHIANPDIPQIAIDAANSRIINGKIIYMRGNIEGAKENWSLAMKMIKPFAKESTLDHSILAPWIESNELLENNIEIKKKKEKIISSGYQFRLQI